MAVRGPSSFWRSPFPLHLIGGVFSALLAWFSYPKSACFYFTALAILCIVAAKLRMGWTFPGAIIGLAINVITPSINETPQEWANDLVVCTVLGMVTGFLVDLILWVDKRYPESRRP